MLGSAQYSCSASSWPWPCQTTWLMKSHLALQWAPQILAESPMKLSIVQSQGHSDLKSLQTADRQAHFMRQFTKYPWSQHRHTTAKSGKKKNPNKSPVEVQPTLQSHTSFCTTITNPWAQFKRYHSWPSNTSTALAEFNSSSSIMYEDPWSSPKTQVSLSIAYLLLLCSYSSVLLKENSCTSAN